ncbi:hypothetical protein C0991_001463 [Blastosporella zonata]|nr:hypothetical protein C0991_001463 [Blastosporella zonata]
MNTDFVFSAIETDLLSFISPCGNSSYAGVGHELRHAHNELPKNAAEVDEMEWHGDRHIGYYLGHILEARPNFGGSFRFVSVTQQVLATNKILEAIMLRSKLKHPTKKDATGKDLSDVLEATVAKHRFSHTTAETYAAILATFEPLVEVAETTFERILRARGIQYPFRPPNYKFMITDLARGSRSRISRKEHTCGATTSKTRIWDENTPPISAEVLDAPRMGKGKGGVPDFFANSTVRKAPPPPILADRPSNWLISPPGDSRC